MKTLLIVHFSANAYSCLWIDYSLFKDFKKWNSCFLFTCGWPAGTEVKEEKRKESSVMCNGPTGNNKISIAIIMLCTSLGFIASIMVFNFNN